MGTSFEHQHEPVLRQSVREYLCLKSGDVAVDATTGLGGHTMDMVEAVGPTGHVYAFDQDDSHLQIARERILERFGEAGSARVAFIHANFEQLSFCLQKEGVDRVNAILFDLGVALPHLVDPDRGFSFQHDGPLDMRMDTSENIPTAADILNMESEPELVRIFYEYGEEKLARRIAAQIVSVRKVSSFAMTKQLEDLLFHAYPAKFRHGRTHPATRVFQALRIAVNRELEVLESALPQAVAMLSPVGRMVVLSYHSLEDRIVKHFFKKMSDANTEQFPSLEILTKRPLIPSDEEISQNPRSRSAKMRVAQKI